MRLRLCIIISLLLCLAPRASFGQQAAAPKNEGLAAVGQQAVSLVLREYALDPTMKVDKTGSPLPRTGSWSVGKRAPRSCPATTETCVEVFYRVPEADVLCEWVVLLQGDGSTGTVIEQNEAAAHYLVRRISAEDAKPLVLEKPLPVYSPIAVAAHVEGDVELFVVISEKDEMAVLSLISGPEMLRSAALDAAKHWKFKPMMVGERAIRYQTTLRFSFHTNGPGSIAQVTLQP